MTRLRVVGLILLATRSAFAAEPAPGAELDDLENLLETDVVSSASKSAERTDEAPAAITVVNGDQLRELGLRSLNEAINFLAVGMLSQNPLHAVEVGVRGVLSTADYGNHVLVVVDGHVMNEQGNGTAYFEQGLGIPLELVDHLELSLGPGSVLYGSSAMLGVINVVTRRARNLKPLQLTLEGGLLPPQGVDGSPQLRSGFGGTGRASLVTGWEHVLGGQSFEVTLGLQYDAQRSSQATARSSASTRTSASS
jgi:outer membrane receptor for ferrienterochelin and colicins